MPTFSIPISFVSASSQSAQISFQESKPIHNDKRCIVPIHFDNTAPLFAKLSFEVLLDFPFLNSEKFQKYNSKAFSHFTIIFNQISTFWNLNG